MSTLTANQHATYEAWAADRERYAEAATGLLQEMTGWTGDFDPEAIDSELAARFLRHYLPRIRDWAATYPEWVR